VHCKVVGYTLDDLKAVDPSMCIHRILMEDDHKPSIESQIRLILNMEEVVMKEILKFLKADNIYPHL